MEDAKKDETADTKERKESTMDKVTKALLEMVENNYAADEDRIDAAMSLIDIEKMRLKYWY